MLADLAALRPNMGVVRALQYGLAIFTLTALIGIANATQVFGALSRDTILAHVHSGTLGWITMGTFGLALWAYGGGWSATAVRNVTITGIATLAYVLAFWNGNLPARAVFGAIELAVIVGWWWWVFGQVRAVGYGSLDNPRLAIFLALSTLVIGSSIGVLAQILFATGNMPQQGPGNPDIIGAHATAQVSGYLVLTAIAIGEWRLRADRGARSLGGQVQAYLLFVAGLAFAVGALFSVQPLLIFTSLFQVIAIIIFAIRVGPSVLGAAWSAAGAGRHFAIAAPFLVLNIILLVVLIQQFIGANGDFTKINFGLLIAGDHTIFIGVMTNILFGTALVLSADRRTWPWADHVVFWGLNAGLLAFVGVLIFGGTESGLIKFSAPVMGLSALLGIATLSLRLQWSASVAPVPAAA